MKTRINKKPQNPHLFLPIACFPCFFFILQNRFWLVISILSKAKLISFGDISIGQFTIDLIKHTNKMPNQLSRNVLPPTALSASVNAKIAPKTGVVFDKFNPAQSSQWFQNIRFTGRLTEAITEALDLP